MQFTLIFIPDIDHDGFPGYLTVRGDDHDESVGREHVEKCREVRIPNLNGKSIKFNF